MNSRTWLRWSLGVAVMLGGSFERSALASKIDVYVLTGQSNSLGTTADPGEADRTPGSEPADAATRFFWDNVSAANSAHPIAQSYGDSGGQITTMKAQQGDGGANPLFWGPEVGFARTMAEHGQTNVMVIKASRGGGGNTFWSKDAFQANPNSGHMYQHVLDTVTAAADALTTAGHSFEIKGLMYLQGESDNSGEANIAGQRFAALLANLRADLPAASNMRAVIGGIGADGDNRNVVRAQQAALALSKVDVEYFTNLDLVDSLYDNLHFDKPAKLEIGRRFATEFLQAAGTLPLVDVTPFGDIADAPDAVNLVFDDYVPDLNGNASGPNSSQPGVFRGFTQGLNRQPAVGLVVDASDGNVLFADHVSGAPASDISIGPFSPPPRSLGGTGGDDGNAIRFTFVDPTDETRRATVASVALNLGFANPSDQITVTFLDVDGDVLHREGVMPAGQFGFQSLDRLGGNLVSNIHQVVVAGNPSASFTIGTPGDDGATDFAFQGFRVVPEPAAATLGAVGALGVLIRGRRRQTQLSLRCTRVACENRCL